MSLLLPNLNFGVGLVTALLTLGSAAAQTSFSLAYESSERRIVEVPDRAFLDSLTQYELAGISSSSSVASREVVGYAPDRGLFTEKAYLDPASADVDWASTPIARIVEEGNRIIAYGPRDEEIAAHEIVPRDGGPRATALANAEMGAARPFRLRLGLTEAEARNLEAAGYRIETGGLAARTQSPVPPTVARRPDHALVYDAAGRTLASIDYDEAGAPYAVVTRKFRAVALPSGDTAYVEMLSVSSRLDTLMSGGVVTRSTIIHRRNHAYYRDGEMVFDLGAEPAPGDHPSDLSVFPNPLTSDRLFVTVPQGITGGGAVVEIYEPTGRLLSESEVRLTPGGLLSLMLPADIPSGSLLVVLRHLDGVHRQIVLVP